MRALVLAGGAGTRLRPLTNTRPKPLLPFMTVPFVQGLLDRLAAAGCTHVTLLVGEDPAPWDGVAAHGVAVEVATEETPLDTAGAARRALRGRGAGPVLVCNGDILTDLDLAGLVGAHEQAGAAATIALVRVTDTSSFGVVVCDADGRVRRFVEKPERGSVDADTVNAGTYVLDPAAFDGFPGDGPLSFERDVFPGLVDDGATVLGVPSEAHWQDLGTPERYLAGHRAVLEGRCRWPVPTGLARTQTGAAVHVDADVHADADIGAGTVLGAGCRVAAGARLTDTVAHAHARVGAEAQVRNAILAEHAAIGDGAVVGPWVVLAEGEKVPPGARRDAQVTSAR